MIDKVLRNSYLYISLPERYKVKYAKENKDEKTGIILSANSKDSWNNKSIPYEIGKVIQVGDGFDKYNRPLSDIYSPGQLVKIAPKKGMDHKIDDEYAYTIIQDSDVISIM